mmetsp:Transcript_37982/g.119182  ORF Transcript_37982/g.119182 Transcript_37982/m.119182 type:complete len:209 (-) Transcript_37982:226-852(-)
MPRTAPWAWRRSSGSGDCSMADDSSWQSSSRSAAASAPRKARGVVRLRRFTDAASCHSSTPTCSRRYACFCSSMRRFARASRRASLLASSSSEDAQTPRDADASPRPWALSPQATRPSSSRQTSSCAASSPVLGSSISRVYRSSGQDQPRRPGSSAFRRPALGIQSTSGSRRRRALTSPTPLAVLARSPALRRASAGPESRAQRCSPE